MNGDALTRWRQAGILFAATIGIAVAGVHFHVVGAMVKPLGDAYGWSRGDIAFALTITAALHPFTNIWIGTMADRYGPRRVALPGIALFCIGFSLLGLAGPQLWTWYAAYGAFAILGAGASSVVFTMAVVQAFTARRGLALAVSLAGAGLLVSLVPLIVISLERLAGLGGIYPLLALAAFGLMFLPAWLFLPVTDSEGLASAEPAPKRAGWRDVIRSGRLWRLALGLLVIASCVGTFIVHFQPMLADAGLTRDEAARVALFIGPAMIAGRIVTGLLFDVLPTRLVATVAFSLPGIACLLLVLLPLDTTTASLLALLIGIGMGSEVDVVAYLSSRYFGLAGYGVVFGILISVYGLAVGMSSWLVGKVYDATGTYDDLLMVLAAAVVGAILLVFSLGSPPEAETSA